MTTIFERLREDHDKHRTLLDLCAKTHGASDGRDELFTKVRAELVSHANAEEKIFYAILLAADPTQEKARHSIAEHKTMDDLIEELDSMDYSNPNWVRKFETLQEKALHHMEEEEREVFQLGGKVLSDAQKAELVADFEREKAHELTN